MEEKIKKGKSSRLKGAGGMVKKKKSDNLTRQGTEVDEVFEKLKKMTIEQIVKLYKKLRKELGLPETLLVQSNMVSPEATANKSASDVSAKEDVYVDKIDVTKQLDTIRLIKTLTGMELPDIHKGLQNLPFLLKKKADKSELNRIKGKLEEVGATVVTRRDAEN